MTRRTAASQTTRTRASGAEHGSLSWDDFEARLTASLGRMATSQYLILSTESTGDEESPYYVQFAQGGRQGFLAEAVSNQFLMGGRQPSPAQEEQIASLGWQFPDPQGSKPRNFTREWPQPAPFHEAREPGGADAPRGLWRCQSDGPRLPALRPQRP